LAQGGSVAGGSGVLVLLAGVRMEGRKINIRWVDRDRLWQAMAGISIATTILSVVICYRWYQFLPYEEFVFIWDANPGLGDPTERAELSKRVDHYWRGNRMSIYIAESKMLYEVQNEDVKKVIHKHDRNDELQKNEYDEPVVSQERRSSPQLELRTSKCTYFNVVHIQRFDHGVVFGPVLLSPQAVDTENMAIFDDGTVSVRAAAEKLENRECV
jgi:hypothetical protein